LLGKAWSMLVGRYRALISSSSTFD